MLLIKLWFSPAQEILFLPNQFLVKYRIRFLNFVFFSEKSPSVSQRSVSQENAFKKNQNPPAFLIWNNFQKGALKIFCADFFYIRPQLQVLMNSP